MEIDLTTRNLTFNELNTQIVLLRKVIKKAKHELIRDLLRRAKKLHPKLNIRKQTVPTKQNQKGFRLLEDINEIKMLNCDEVAKFALINEKSFNEIAKKRGTEKERALARLSEHVDILMEVQNFRKTFPRWSFQVKSLLNTWKFNDRVMKRKSLRQLKKEKKKLMNEKVEEKDEEVTEEKDGKEIDEDLKELKEIEMEEHDDANLISGEAEVVEVPAKKLKSDSINSPTKKTSKVVKASGERLSLKKTIETFKHSEEKIDISMGEVVVKRFHLDNVESEELKIPSKHKSSDTVSTSNPSNSMPRSSFFLDMDNNELGLGESDEEVADSRGKGFEKSSKMPNPKRKSLKPAGFKSNSRNTSQNSKFPNNKNNLKQKGTPSAPVELHPSWAAKRNQRQHIFTEVKANKIIKFDD